MLLKQNARLQTAHFGETQHKFLKTTDAHGAAIEPEDEEDEESGGKSLLQTIQDTTSLCNCCPCLRPDRDSTIMGASNDGASGRLTDSPKLLRNGKVKKKVVPNTNQDHWLKYMVMNLG
jgi:hypothetical protein